MIFRPRSARRSGAIVILLAFSLVALLTFVALAIDLGLMMISRTQCQDTADAAAMAGARTLTGDVTTNNNYANVLPNATAAATAHQILGQPVAASQVTVTVGDYYYDSTARSFKSQVGGRQPGDNWTLAQATVTFKGNFFFGRLMGQNTFNQSATATGVHRPRDLVVIQDFSGSMRFDSLLGSQYYGARTLSMNAESVYPQFGHYSGNSSQLTYSGPVQAYSGEIQGATNTVAATADGAPVVNGFYGDSTPFGTNVPAFTQASAAYATTPGGDNYLFTNQNASTTYAHSISDITGGTTRDPNWELDGYAAYPTSNLQGKNDYSTVPFNGYTQGPSYWGKTFFIWPPDPRQKPSTYRNTAVVQQFLWDIIPSLTPAQQAAQNPPWIQGIYNKSALAAGSNNWTSWSNAATLKAYLQSSGFRPILTSGQIEKILRLFSLAGSGSQNQPVAAGMPKNSSGQGVAADWRARFFLMPDGVTPVTDNSVLWNAGTWNAPDSTTYLINYNAILDWIKNSGPNPFPNQLRAGGVVYYTAIPNTIDTTTFPPTDPNQRFWKEYIDEVLGVQQTDNSPNYNQIVSRTGYGDDIPWGTVQTRGVPAGIPPATCMAYGDNPNRPLVHFWFGPMSMLDFLGNYNMGRFWWPGTVREAPTYQTKLGMQAALKDILRNHPNDNVAQIFFSSPKDGPGSTGYYNTARTPLGRNYLRMVNSLWFSPKVIDTNAEISVFDGSGNLTSDITDVPRANGGTCYAMPLMLAYNQLSSNSALVNYTRNALPGTAGGLGRNGSTKVIIFETDGMVNTGAQANLTAGAQGQGYYRVRLGDANNMSDGANEFPTGVYGVSFSTGAAQSTTIAQQIVTDFSTPRKPVLIHCIAFGSLFEPSNSSSFKANALQNLANLEVIGSVQKGSPTTLAPNKIIVGDFNARIQLLQAAFRGIMEDGIQVTLISSGSGKP